MPRKAKKTYTSPMFPLPDPNLVSLLCNETHEREWFDLRDGPVFYDADEEIAAPDGVVVGADAPDDESDDDN